MSMPIDRRGITAMASGLCGVILVLLIASAVSKPDQDLKASIDRFEELSRQEQDRIRNTQAQMDNLSDEERGRIESIHAAVSTDPELSQKLDEFYTWWSAQPIAVRADLKQLQKSSPDEWLALIKERIHLDRNKVREIVVDFRGPRRPGDEEQSNIQIQFTLDDFESFLDEVAPNENLTEEEESVLGLLEHKADRLLARTIWRFDPRRMFANSGGPAPDGQGPQRDRGSEYRSSYEGTVSAFWDNLISSDTLNELEQRIERQFEDEQNSPRDGRRPEYPSGLSEAEYNRLRLDLIKKRIRFEIFVQVLTETTDQLGQDFRQRHKPAISDLAAIYEELESGEQMELMTRDPSEVGRYLENQAIISSQQSGQPVVELTRQLNSFQQDWRRMRWPFQRGFGGGPSRGGGSGGGFGGGRPGGQRPGGGSFSGGNRDDRNRQDRGDRPPQGDSPRGRGTAAAR